MENPPHYDETTFFRGAVASALPPKAIDEKAAIEAARAYAQAEKHAKISGALFWALFAALMFGAAAAFYVSTALATALWGMGAICLGAQIYHGRKAKQAFAQAVELHQQAMR